MADWIIPSGIALLLALALPSAIVAAKRSIKGNGRMAGIALAIGAAFAFLHDPRRHETIESVARRRREDEAGEG